MAPRLRARRWGLAMTVRALVLAVATLLGSGCSGNEPRCAHLAACSLSGLCVDMYTLDPPSAAVMACEANGGELISSCPTTDLVASCTPAKCETISYFYVSFTVDLYGHGLAFREASCRERGGAWTTY